MNSFIIIASKIYITTTNTNPLLFSFELFFDSGIRTPPYIQEPIIITNKINSTKTIAEDDVQLFIT